jgi:hypothetical protein
MYGMFHDCAVELGESGMLHGIAMFDKLKLRLGFYSNFKDGCSTTAMVASLGMSTLSLAVDLQEFITKREENKAMDEAVVGDKEVIAKKDGSNYTDAMYINVFHLKISSGLTHNAEYFFNGRSLTSDELLGQLLWIITCFEIIGTQIHAMNCDAGGPNTGPVNTIHHEKKIPIGWLPEECVSFLNNPVDPDHWVCIMLCNVNNFRNYQGALNQSEPDDTRFFAKGGIGWGWPALTHFYHADVRINGNAPQTAL